jgi:DNA-binding MarR family transcriptional regulator
MTQITAKKDHQEFLLEKFLPYRLSLLSNTVSEGISDTYRKQYGLSVTEWRVVAILGRFPGLTASEVMERGAMDKVPVSRAVNKLQEKNLVDRNPHSEDRRRLPLELTMSGKKMYRDIVPKALAYENTLLSALSASDQKTLNRIITSLQGASDRLNRLQ